EDERTAFGAALVVGAEYRFAPGLTLGATHAFGLSVERGEERRRHVDEIPGNPPRDVETLQEFSAFRVGTNTTTLFLSVYF
ncbi:MAG TPA: hypothetical protein VD962_09960, partial [Rubricoccaceae bacterium]|nr:hypothetical protein [Rubricoccaceae bacterium]